MPEELVEGWTEPIIQTLKADGAAINGTGLGLDLELRDREGGLVEAGATKVDWIDAASGQARFSPAAEDFRSGLSPYHARWKVTAASKDAYFPNGEADVWVVRK